MECVWDKAKIYKYNYKINRLYVLLSKLKEEHKDWSGRAKRGICQANVIHSANVGLIWGQRLRRCPNINPMNSDEYIVFTV